MIIHLIIFQARAIYDFAGWKLEMTDENFIRSGSEYKTPALELARAIDSLEFRMHVSRPANVSID